MRVTTKIVFDSMGNVLEHDWFEYEGPVALCDRWAQGAEKAATAADLAASRQYGSSAATAGAQLTPFFAQEMRAQHMFTPGQTNEMLTASGAGAGGATAGLEGAAKLQQARTRNASGFTKSLEEIARDQAKASAGMSEGIAAKDVMGAQELRQAGAKGMEGMYGTDVNAQLQAMGQETKDIQGEVEAGKSGWLQNAMSVAKTAADVGTAAANLGWQPLG